jgi:SAM-dependent methyltransferase
MFFADTSVAFVNIVRALRPGGRLVLLVWHPAPANEWILEITTAMAAGRPLPAPPPDGPQPFSLSDPDRLRGFLEAGGFGEEGRRRAIEGLRACMEAHEGHDGVTFGSACWLVTAVRLG